MGGILQYYTCPSDKYAKQKIMSGKQHIQCIYIYIYSAARLVQCHTVNLAYIIMCIFVVKTFLSCPK